MNSPNNKLKKRTLVVDDEPYSVANVVEELEQRQFDVKLAHTTAEALRLLGSTAYDAVLLDLMLPRNEVGEPKRDPPLAENGVEVLSRLVNGGFERGGTSRAVPVFAISALGPEALSVLKQVRDLGVKEIFNKPIPPIRVAETIRLAVEKA